MEKRYDRNFPAITEQEQELLASQHVLVIGCGGLGGYLIEFLARVGVGEMTVVDGDVFETSNLNRQLLSTDETLGHGKAEAAGARAELVNPSVRVHVTQRFFDADNAEALVAGKSLVLDALDNVPARLLLEDVCARQGVTIVHGAIQGWTAQVTVARPGCGVLHGLYGQGAAVRSKTSLSFTPPFCASVQAAEAVRLLCGRPPELDGMLLLADLQHMEWELIPV